MDENPFEVGSELFNENKGMSLGVVVDADDQVVTTEGVSGQTIDRGRDDLETLLDASSLEQRDAPGWF